MMTEKRFMKFSADILSKVKGSEVPKLSDNAQHVLESRYLLKNEQGEVVESPDELFRRVAKAVSQAELGYSSVNDAAYWEEAFYSTMRSLFFLPNSPTLMNAGLPDGQLSACFVLPIEDSMDSIFTTLKQAALIQQSGGGTGFNFSHLRPRGDLIRSTGGQSSGPVSFIKIYDAATENIKQGGRRRGANMGILNMDHPDIEEFIQCKKDEDALQNFNISVGMSDAFIQALAQDASWKLIHPNSKKVVKQVRAQKLWDMLTQSAWETGDPGIVFLDTIQKNNPLASLGPIDATNPCGEMPLLDYESCNLGSVNLSRMVKSKAGQTQIDWKKLEAVVVLGIRFLDNVIDMNHYALPTIKAVSLGNRKIGLGVMGWAELLIQLEIPYHSLKALELGRKLMRFIQQVSFETSVALGRQRGPFKHWRKSSYFAQHLFVRNATRNSIAPTGTIAIIADTSPSIEPLYALAFQRQHILDQETLHEVNQHVIAYLKAKQLYHPALMDQIEKSGSVQQLASIPSTTKNLLETALEIPFQYHLKHQQAFQQYTDNAVSKTTNLPHQTKAEDISAIYQMAWQLGLKGITVYRDGSKAKQVLSVPELKQTHYQPCRVCMN